MPFGQEIARLFVTVGGNIEDLQKSLGAADASFAKSTQSLQAAGKTMSLAVTAPLVGLGVASLKSAADYERLGNKLQAITDADAAAMDRLNKKALQLGKDTQFSAGEAAKGMLELTKAGLSVDDTYDAIDGTLALAAAAEIDVGKASEIAANALNAFHLEGREVGRVADVLAATANSSSVEISDVADSLKMVSAVASSAGMSLEEVTAIIGELGNVGLKGSDAGTSLKQMILSLQAPTDKAAGLLQEMGVQVYDATGKMNDMRSIVGQLESATKGMTQQERDFTLATIFGSDAVRAANILIDQGVGGYDKMYGSVTKAGAASKMADANMRGLGGALEYFKGTLDTLMISSGTPWLGMLEKMVRGSADLIAKFGEVPPKVQEATVVFAVAAAAGGPFMMATAKIAESMMTIGKAAGRVGGSIGTAIDKIRGETKELENLAGAGKKAADAKKGVADQNDKLTQAAEKAAGGLAKESGILGTIKGVGGGALESVGKMAGGAIAAAIGGWIATGGAASILGGIGTALGGAAAAVAGVIGAPALLIAAAIIGAIVGGIWAWQNWDQIKAWFGDWTGKVGEWLAPIRDAIGQKWQEIVDGAGEALQNARDSVGNAAAEIRDRITGAINGIPGAIQGALVGLVFGAGFAFETVLIFGGRFLDWLGTLPDKVGTELNKAKDALIGKLGEAWSWIETEVPSWPGRAAAFLRELKDRIGEAAGEAKDALIGKLGEAWAWVTAEVPSWPGRVYGFLLELRDRANDAIIQARDAIVGGLRTAWGWVTTEVPTWAGRFYIFLQELGPNAWQLGTEVYNAITGKLSEALAWMQTELPKWPELSLRWLQDMGAKVGQAFGHAKDEAGRILGELKDSAGQWGENIKNAILGPLGGLVDGVRRIFDEVGKVFRDGREKAQEEWGIHSPSSVARQMGQAITQGFQIGLGDFGSISAIPSPGAMAAPAAAQAPTQVTIIVQGSVMTERDLADAIREQLLNLGRRNVSVGLA